MTLQNMSRSSIIAEHLHEHSINSILTSVMRAANPPQQTKIISAVALLTNKRNGLNSSIAAPLMQKTMKRTMCYWEVKVNK